ncbi:Protein detoxification 35 [Vitis vinifera]|uniref:Protein detoxification 35 n=1 Tax=Vitis vinifera TaxID=29760 RepID=A0A438E2T5_VITVI|nr:Protein detoxification 35 [Vitis vinifera]
MGSALETLCGQAYGAGQVQLLGVYLQRSWIILLVSCVILLPIYIFATPILKVLGQEDEIADLAGQFTIETIPQLFSLAIIFPTQKFLQAQSKVNVQATICFVALILDIGLLAVFIFVFGWGTTGAAIAYDISNWVIAVAQVVYAIGWCKEGWTGLTWSAFRDLGFCSAFTCLGWTLGGHDIGTASQTLILLFIVYRTNCNREVSSLTFESALWLLQFASHGSQSSSVEQTTERMQKWGGQRIEPDDV